jgi:hypothetical protein
VVWHPPTLHSRCRDRSGAVGAGAASLAQIHLTVLRVRAELVHARTALVNAARGLVKSNGQSLPEWGTQRVNRELAVGLHAELREVLEPLLQGRAHPGIRGADGSRYHTAFLQA